MLACCFKTATEWNCIVLKNPHKSAKRKFVKVLFIKMNRQINCHLMRQRNMSTYIFNGFKCMIRIKFWSSLPGHSFSLHSSCAVDSPSQTPPSYSGTILFRLFVIRPKPHVTEHSLTCHRLQRQFTIDREEFGMCNV